ncbi:g-protein alpha subunit domain-containing protein [Ditylenchus destructor]|uniref:G-protein alpha subunit domain-containing protein n=1 Tax=Ditylenchus destructor TaxID=166010 RepID=A0AAD4RDS1_9BILA|nr:g-protein alpha subunit domain-containing protein [Ditylenchus destructor]
MGQLYSHLCCRSERDNNHAPDERTHHKVKRGRDEDVVRFFMTGLGSAGKSTIVRQLHLLCNRNSNYKVCDEDWREVKNKDPDSNNIWATTIRRNILDSFDIFIKQIEKDEEEFENAENKQFAEQIEEICEAKEEGIEGLELTEEFRKGLICLYNDETIRNVYKKRNKIDIEGKKLFDGCDYFFNEAKITEAFQENYVASDSDKVHSRSPTVDMHTYRFKLNDTRIEICDVGGQRSELIKIVDYLRHWSFNSGEQNHNFILLVVSMSDYNIKHEEYEGTLLDECVEYMKVLLNNKVAQNCGLLIFFNKKDRFKEKLQDPECREDIAYLMPYLSPNKAKDYLTKGKFEEKQMSEALSNKFVEAIKEVKNRERNTYCRYTCAVDSKMMEGIFGAIKDDIIQETIFSVLP